jgi:hypothetical protein
MLFLLANSAADAARAEDHTLGNVAVIASWRQVDALGEKCREGNAGPGVGRLGEASTGVPGSIIAR